MPGSDPRPEQQALPGTPGRAPGSPVGGLLARVPRIPLGGQQGFQHSLSRARALDDDFQESRGLKRAASEPLEGSMRGRPAALAGAPTEPSQPSSTTGASSSGEQSSALAGAPTEPAALQPSSTIGATPAFEALALTSEEIDQIAYGSEQVHPLLQVRALAEHDRRFPFDFQEYDSGTWDGRWSLPSKREWQLRVDIGECFPVGNEHHLMQCKRAGWELKDPSAGLSR